MSSLLKLPLLRSSPSRKLALSPAKRVLQVRRRGSRASGSSEQFFPHAVAQETVAKIKGVEQVVNQIEVLNRAI